MGNSRNRLLWGFGFGFNPRKMTERTEGQPGVPCAVLLPDPRFQAVKEPELPFGKPIRR